MLPDDEGFLAPQVDASVCVACGRCMKACPVLNVEDFAAPIHPLAFMAKARDEPLRMASTSGGVFSLLARQVLSNNGVVFGAAYDSVEGRVFHRSVKTESDLGLLRGAKYVQSDVGNTYGEAFDCLQTGRPVLYSGTPCQIAGLKAFLSTLSCENQADLLTVEVVCNSVPSPLILKKWLDASGIDRAEGQLLYFRDKAKGWRYQTLEVSAGAAVALPNPEAYYAIWQTGYTVRCSCLNCRFRNLRSGADVTIGDAWGIEKMEASAAALDDGKGVSLVMAHTEIGRRAVDQLGDLADMRVVAFSDACRSNPAIVKTPDCLFAPGSRRRSFWSEVKKSDNVIQVALRFVRPPLKVQVRRFAGRVLRKLGLRK